MYIWFNDIYMLLKQCAWVNRQYFPSLFIEKRDKFSVIQKTKNKIMKIVNKAAYLQLKK